MSATAGSSGVVTVSAPGATGSPKTVQVNVSNAPSGAPFGSFDTPANNSTGISGAVAVTGWALDNVEVTNVDIWREKVGSPTPMEEDMLDFGFDVRPNSRLSCQIKVSDELDGLVVATPERQA